MAIGRPNLYPEAPPCPDVAAHQQKISHSYLISYPAHEPRAHDPHKHDFLAWKQDRKTGNTWYCDFAREHRNGDESECDTTHPLEAHHKILELAMVNEVDFALLEEDYPGVSNPDLAGAWIDSDKNLALYCRSHHRGPMGVHCASASDFGSEAYVRNLIQARLQVHRGCTLQTLMVHQPQVGQLGCACSHHSSSRMIRKAGSMRSCPRTGTSRSYMISACRQ